MYVIIGSFDKGVHIRNLIRTKEKGRRLGRESVIPVPPEERPPDVPPGKRPLINATRLGGSKFRF